MNLHQITSYAVAGLLALGSAQAFAGNIVKCVNPNTGKVTFTDKPCTSKQQTQKTRLTKQPLPTEKQERDFKISEIRNLTKQANAQCSEQYMDRFRSDNPKLRVKPAIEFPSILERSINRDAVHIILEGTAKYAESDKMINTDLKCTASKRSGDNGWQIVLKNTAQFATAIEKKSEEKPKISEEKQRELGSLWK